MYKYKIPTKTSITVNTSYVGERIEEKINRILNNKEPISDGAPRIYTDRAEGVNPAYDIRTDRFEIAVDAMDKVQKSHMAKREERAKTLGEKAKEGMSKEESKPSNSNEPGGQSIHGTGGTGDSK